MNKLFGIILILVGGYLIALGINRKNSFIGHVDTTSTDVANSVNGGTSEPKHVIYIAGGALLVIVGVVALTRSRSSS